MEVKNINTRIQNKYDSLSNWQASNLELLPGEIAFVKVLDQKVDETTGESYTVPAVLAKVGEADDNGEVKTFEELPWLSAKASDVYNWAKQKEKPNYTLEELGAEYAGAAVAAVSVHNLDNLSHSDIRTLIEELMERVDTLESNPSAPNDPSNPDNGIASGAQSDWLETNIDSPAYIKNKPFEELLTTLEIPSDKTNSTIVSSSPIEDLGVSFSFIKITENTFDTAKDTYGSILKVEVSGELLEFTINEENIVNLDNGFGVLIVEEAGFYPLIMNVSTAGTSTFYTEDVIGANLVFDNVEPGLYFLYIEGMGFVQSLDKISIKKLDSKFIPNKIGTWENMPDKPFSESGFDIRFSAGTITDVSVTVNSPWSGPITFYKVAEAQSTSMLDGQVVADFYSNSQMKLPIKPESDDYDDDYEYISYFELASGSSHCIYAFNIVNDNETVDLSDFYETNVTFPVKGFYITDAAFIEETDMAALRVVSANYKIKHIDNKFIQNAFYERGTNITWDGTPTNICESASADGNYLYFYKVSEPVDSIIGGTVVALYPDGEPENVLTSEAVKTTYAGEDGTLVINVKVPNSTFSHESGFDISFSEPGLYFIYFISNEGSELRTKSFKTFDYELKQIDKKFIPSGVTSWNDLADKPFGETTITWDGTYTSESVDVGDGYLLCKVSDVFCTPESLIGKKAKMFTYEENTSYEYTITSEDIYTEEASAGAFVVQVDGNPGIFITNSAVTIGEVSFPSAGTWFLYIEDTAYLCYLEGAGKQIDPSYIPGYYYEKGTKFTWDGTPADDIYIPLGQIVEWDGSDTGVSIAIPSNGDTIPEGVVLCKVAEKWPSLDGSHYISVANEGHLYSGDNIETFYDDNGNIIATCGTCGSSNNRWIWNVEQVAPIPIMGVEVTFPESGLYFVSQDGSPLVTCLYDSLYNEYDGVGLCRVTAPLADDLYGWVARVYIPNENYTLEMPIVNQASGQSMEYLRTSTGSSCGLPYVFNIVTDNETIDLTDWFGTELTFPKAGLYMFDFSVMGVTLDCFISPDYQLKKIDKKFLPDDIGGSGSSAAIYSGYVSIADEDKPIDLSVINYEKVMAAASYTSSSEELWSYFTYDIQADEFTLAMQSMNKSSECLVTAKSNNIRIGLCSKLDAGSYTAGEFKTVIELYNTKNIDISNKFTIKCYRRPGTDWYDGFIETGVANKIQSGLKIPVSSNAVYSYIADMGLDPEEIEDTRIKANTQVDWAENDSTSMAYIKNRLVYDDNFHPSIINTSKPVRLSDSFGSETMWSTACEYRLLEKLYDNAERSAIDMANNISRIVFKGIDYSSFNVFGDADCAIVKSTVSSDFPPFLVIKNTPTSYLHPTVIEGFSIPSSLSKGVYGLTATDDIDYSDMYVSAVDFKLVPHKLPVQYIPTDEEIQYGSSNLISSGAVYDALANINGNIQTDEVPTLNSENLIKSGGVAAALEQKADKATTETSINTINEELNKKASQTELNTVNTKIDTQVNNLTVEINKKVNQTDFNTEINKKVNSENVYTKSEIDGFLTGAFHYKGSVDTFAELPVNAKVGDTYNVKNANAENKVKAGDNVVWCEIDGVGHWDVLSGIVDLSAYWTSEETQVNLDEKVSKTEISAVAYSNDYLDLANKPCYSTGVDQLVIGDPSYNASDYYYSLYYYPKRADYIEGILLEDYIKSFKSISYGEILGDDFVTYTKDLVNISVTDNNIAVISTSLVESPLALIIPTAGLSYNLMNKKVITFATAGIYCLVNIKTATVNRRKHVNKLIFEADTKVLDLKLLPEHSHTISEISGLSSTLDTKVDKDDNARLMTNAEATKLAGIATGANNYTLPAATTSTLGGVKVGDNLSISADGTISAASLDWSSVQNKPETFTPSEHTHNEIYYTESEIDTIVNAKQDKSNLVTAINSVSQDTQYPSAKLLYTIKTELETGITAKVDKSENARLITNEEASKLAGIAENANKYSLPAATKTSLGGVKVGENLSVSTDGTISATSLAWDNVQNKPELYTKTEINSSLDTKQDKSNLVTSVSSSATDTQYPSAKLLYTTKTNLETQVNDAKTNLQTQFDNTKSDLQAQINDLHDTTQSNLHTIIDTKQDISNLVTSIDENSTDIQYPSAKLLYNIIGDCTSVLNEISALLGE